MSSTTQPHHDDGVRLLSDLDQRIKDLEAELLASTGGSSHDEAEDEPRKRMRQRRRQINDNSSNNDNDDEEGELEPIQPLPETLLPPSGTYSSDGHRRRRKPTPSTPLLGRETTVPTAPKPLTEPTTCDMCHETYYTAEAYQRHVKSIKHRQNIILQAGAAYAPLQHTANYCKPCALQLASKEEYLSHCDTATHRARKEAVTRASYCSLCSKQFTSPLQLRGHVEGKPHREAVQKRTGYVPR
jgi:hypothetical protein